MIKGTGHLIVQALAVGVLLIAGCTKTPSISLEDDLTNYSLEELIEILSDPTSLRLVEAANEIGNRGLEAADAAPILAVALSYPRRDSILVARSLAALGEDGRGAVPLLVASLRTDRADVRQVAVAVLGFIGEPARCAVPEIAVLLWDSDAYARTSAAVALDRITGVALSDSGIGLALKDPTNGIADEPEGSKTDLAREWWIHSGSFMEWPTGSADCEPSQTSLNRGTANQ